MTERDLLHALQNTDSKYIREAEQRAADAAVKQPRRIKPFLLAAAGLAACFGLVLFAMHVRSKPDDTLVASNDPTEQIAVQVTETTAESAETEVFTTETTTDTEKAVISTQTSAAQKTTSQKTTATAVGTTDRPVLVTTVTAKTGGKTEGNTLDTKAQTTSTVRSTTTTKQTETQYNPFSPVTQVFPVTEVDEYSVGVGITGRSTDVDARIDMITLEKYGITNVCVGDELKITYDGTFLQTYPAQFSNIYSVEVLNTNMTDTPTVQIEPDDVYVWRDLIQENTIPTNVFRETDELRTAIPAFPDTEFIWRHYGIYCVRNGIEKMIIGNENIYSSMAITPWQVYFTDMTGDGYPEVCINFTMGADFFCTQNVYIYDYLNDEAYGFIGTRGETDYVLRCVNGQMLAEEFPYSSHPVLKFNEMTGTTGTLSIQDGELAFTVAE